MMLFPTISFIKGLNIHPSKKRGQNFLIDRNMAARAVACAHIAPGDRVIEIGPGLGSLTYFLHGSGIPAHCFEVDSRLAGILKDALPGEALQRIIEKDILTVDCDAFLMEGPQAVLIGSIPYSITTPIFLKFLKESRLFKRAVFIVQKEVAERLCAPPGGKEYGILSVYCHAYMQAHLHAVIPPQCFYPKPKIESAILELVPLPDRQWEAAGESFFRQVVRAAFSKRRKTLFNCLKGFAVQHTVVPEALRAEAGRRGIDLGRRAETLTVEEFYALAQGVAMLAPHGDSPA